MPPFAQQLEAESPVPLILPGFIDNVTHEAPVAKPRDESGAKRVARNAHAARKFRRTRMALSAVRLIPHIALLLRTREDDFIRADMKRWADIWAIEEPKSNWDFVALLVNLMTFAKEFRNIFYLRLGMKAKLFYLFAPPLATLELHSSNIGPGLFIQHGGSTIVSAERIGKNCWINQQVTIGFSNDGDQPIIGDNVKVFAGAKIVGKARVGDNVTVGVNSVVLGKVPSNVTVIGVPAQIVWKAKGA